MKSEVPSFPTLLGLETLRTVYFKRLHELGEIYNHIENTNPRLVSLSKSQFYRIIEKLEESKSITSTREGKVKLIDITDLGKKLLMDFQSYILGFMRDQLFNEEVLNEIRDLTTPILGCLRKYKIASIGPYAMDLTKLLEACKECRNPELNVTVQRPLFIALPGTYSIISSPEFIKIDVENPYDLIPKDGSVDIIFSSSVYYRYGIDFIKELQRILSTDGVAFLLEPTNNIPNMIIRIMNQMLKHSYTMTMDSWEIGDRSELVTIDDLKKELKSLFSSVSVRSEFAFTFFVCHKG